MGKIRIALLILAMIGPRLVAPGEAAAQTDVHSPWADDADVLGAVGAPAAKPVAPPPVEPSSAGQPSPEEELRLVDDTPGAPGPPAPYAPASPPAPYPSARSAQPGSDALRQRDLAPAPPQSGTPAIAATPAGRPPQAMAPATAGGNGLPPRPGTGNAGSDAPLPVYIGIRAR